MNFADYDRNGAASEFLLQVGTQPCGKHQFAAIGIASDGRLRALSSAAKPDAPLMMPLGAWQALAKGAGPSVVPTLTCGDHGSESRIELVVSAAKGSIWVKNLEYSCPAKGKREKLIEEVKQQATLKHRIESASLNRNVSCTRFHILYRPKYHN